ncbi:Zn-dependent hydrolase [Acinetobacter ihumii]|uniref:Zn-dependent hydrolase n=1 Tax=Acinetobacter ihumii TaxID=2483802 RepID=UPI001BC8834C|nr:Zn-dependent hydrolase [Acinetobacter ihumii]
MTINLRINPERLLTRISRLAQVGAIDGGGVCRLAFTEQDKLGRDLVIQWMHELDLHVTIDGIGNVVATRTGKKNLHPVMTGSHIDTVRTGGRYDGNLGVLAGLEVIETLNEAGIETDHPISVAFFSNEEGARFAPDMMGSLVFQGGLSLEDAYQTQGIDGTTVRENLEKIGYIGGHPVGQNNLHAFIELHVEQGPILEHEQKNIGAVTGVQGIRWIEFTIKGVSNHAGTTPMRLRHNAGLVAMKIATYVHQLAEAHPGQLVTIGFMELKPNLVNVIPNDAKFTIDLRNTDQMTLNQIVTDLLAQAKIIALEEGVELSFRDLANFQSVSFDERIIASVESFAKESQLSVQRLSSGAGHDAQIISRMCPTGMIFVPSVAGLSHNVKEFTHDADVVSGANLLLKIIYELANGKIIEETQHA